MLKQIHVQRTLSLAAQSAIEETCARVESTPAFRRFQIPPLGSRDVALDTGLDLPRTYSTPLTEEDYKSMGVEVGPVTVGISAWVQKSWEAPAGHTLHRAIAVLEFRMKIVSRETSPTVEKTVVARRFVESSPEVDGSTCRLKVQSHDLFFAVD